MSLPTSIQIPVSAPQDFFGVAQFFTVLSQSLNQWIGMAAIFINGFQGFTFAVDGSGNLVAVGPNGTRTVIAAP